MSASLSCMQCNAREAILSLFSCISCMQYNRMEEIIRAMETTIRHKRLLIIFHRVTMHNEEWNIKHGIRKTSERLLAAQRELSSMEHKFQYFLTMRNRLLVELALRQRDPRWETL